MYNSELISTHPSQICYLKQLHHNNSFFHKSIEPIRHHNVTNMSFINSAITALITVHSRTGQFINNMNLIQNSTNIDR